MTITRRDALAAIAATAGTGYVNSATAAPSVRAASDQTSALQAMIDASAPLGRPVVLPAGATVTGPLILRPGTVIIGTGHSTRLVFTGGGAALTASDADGIRLINFTIDAAWKPLGGDRAVASFTRCKDLAIDGVTVRHAAGHGISLVSASGRIERCAVENVSDAGIFALDCRLTVADNSIDQCGNNGILIWRSGPAEDGSQVRGNRIARVRADAGGSGQNGNGINIFRAGSVSVSGNSITDCAYSAVRGNASSNISITGNHCLRLGEVAIYAEFGFEGALIANNIVDQAATGVAVTNFNEGGRLAVVQGNVIRNLFRRDHEPVDTRGHGIAIEADTAVSGNTIEGAPTAGILVGWGRYMRDVSVTGNVIRKSRSGMLVSADAIAGTVLVSGNMISGATDGAIRAHDRGRVFGPDYVREPTTGRVTIMANVAS